MKTTTTPYDVAEHLRTPEEMATCLESWNEDADEDAAFIAKALGDTARAQGMPRDSGLSRESFYRVVTRERSPSFDTILKVDPALRLKLNADVRSDREVS
jgi:probable addiction module antidote protein